MYDIMVIIIIVLITLLKKMLNKIQEFEKRLDDTKIVQLDEKKEHTENTEKMLNKIQELEKLLDDNNIIDFCEALDLQNKIQELEKRLDYDAIKVLYEHSDKIEKLEQCIADLDENKEVVNKIVIAFVGVARQDWGWAPARVEKEFGAHSVALLESMTEADAGRRTLAAAATWRHQMFEADAGRKHALAAAHQMGAH